MAKAATRKPAARKAKPAAGRVVEAALSAGAGGRIGGPVPLDPRAIEQAMADATAKALKSGVTDAGEILKLKLAARERVKADHRKAEKAEIARIQAEATKGN